MQSVTLSLYRFGAARARAWALFQMGPARFALRAIPKIGTVKLCGSGVGEGFTPVPDTSVYAILATWPDHDTARRAMFGTRIFRRYAEMSEERMTVFLTPTSARAALLWDAAEPVTPQEPVRARRPRLGPDAGTGGNCAAQADFWRQGARDFPPPSGAIPNVILPRSASAEMRNGPVSVRHFLDLPRTNDHGPLLARADGPAHAPGPSRRAARASRANAVPTRKYLSHRPVPGRRHRNRHMGRGEHTRPRTRGPPRHSTRPQIRFASNEGFHFGKARSPLYRPSSGPARTLKTTARAMILHGRIEPRPHLGRRFLRFFPVGTRGTGKITAVPGFAACLPRIERAARVSPCELGAIARGTNPPTGPRRGPHRRSEKPTPP